MNRLSRIGGLLMLAIAPAVISFQTTTYAEEQFAELIDASLSAWKTTGEWTVDEQKVLQLEPKSSGFRLFPDIKTFLWLREPQTDFVLELEYKLAADARSGVFIRTTSLSQHLEIQLCNPPADPTTSPDDLTDEDCGGLVDHAPPSCIASKPAGQWNSMRIDCRGHDLIVDINDKNVLKFDFRQDDTLQKMNRGMIALQNQSLRVSFRNIRIQKITDPAVKTDVVEENGEP